MGVERHSMSREIRLPYQQALFAVFTLLDDVFDLTHETALRGLLVDMNPFVFKERIPADLAIWNSWLDCVRFVQCGEKLTTKETMDVLMKFLSANVDEYGYNVDCISDVLMSLQKQGRVRQLFEKIAVHTVI
jgi:hypothetical protein